MKSTVGVILAAGRGSRMQGLTEAKPKCLLELAGRPLLHWQLDGLRAAGLERVIVVRGYKPELLAGDFETVDNPRWESTNMVQSLLCAAKSLPESTLLVSYSDIVFKSAHVSALLLSKDDIAITYDTEWQKLWGLRNANPLDDAETFREQGGRLLAIGEKPETLDDVQGQYMGLLRFSPRGIAGVRRCVDELPEARADKLDMTSLLRLLLAKGIPIGAVPVHGGWCECDTPKDIELYEQHIAKKGWLHDWRQES